MAESEKHSILGHPVHPEDITLTFVSQDWPEKEVIIYDKSPFNMIIMLLYHDMRNDVFKALVNCKNPQDVFTKYDDHTLRQICQFPENFKELKKEDLLMRMMKEKDESEEKINFVCLMLSSMDFFVFDGLPISMSETPVGIGLVDGNKILHLPYCPRKYKNPELKGIDQLMEKCKRNDSQRLFESQKLIGSPTGLPIYVQDDEEDLDEEIIYVGPTRSNHEKYSILPVVQLRGLASYTTVVDLIQAYCLHSLNTSLPLIKGSLQIE